MTLSIKTFTSVEEGPITITTQGLPKPLADELLALKEGGAAIEEGDVHKVLIRWNAGMTLKYGKRKGVILPVFKLPAYTCLDTVTPTRELQTKGWKG